MVVFSGIHLEHPGQLWLSVFISCHLKSNFQQFASSLEYISLEGMSHRGERSARQPWVWIPAPVHCHCTALSRFTEVSFLPCEKGAPVAAAQHRSASGRGNRMGLLRLNSGSANHRLVVLGEEPSVSAHYFLYPKNKWRPLPGRIMTNCRISQHQCEYHSHTFRCVSKPSCRLITDFVTSGFRYHIDDHLCDLFI